MSRATQILLDFASRGASAQEAVDEILRDAASGLPNVRRTDPPSSRISARAARLRAGSGCRRVLEAVRELGEATCDEIVEKSGIKWNSASRRITDLLRMDPPLLEDTGRMRTTAGGGRQRIVRVAQ